MAKRASDQTEQPKLGKYGNRYPLLVYRVLARRYRPVGVLLLAVGLLAQIPHLITELRPQNSFITFEALSLLGLGAIGVGLLLWLAAQIEVRRAYVQCHPDYLVINTGSGRVAIAYQRFNALKPVKVAGLFKLKDEKGRQKAILKPLMRETALEALVSEFPLPEEQMRRRLHRFLFSPRDKAFLFIVPRSTSLSLEIATFTDRARTAAREDAYQDPFERAATR